MSRPYSFGGDRARSVLLAVVVVLSAVFGAAGPALAQTATDSGPISYTYTDSPETLVIVTSALDGGTEFTVEYTTQGGPSTGTTVLARETYNTANLDADELLFYNEGAYEAVNVTVSGYSGGEPTFEKRSGLGSINLVRTVVGTTGGDSDLTCDTTDKIGNIVSGVTNLDCTPQPGSTTVNTTGLDATQAEINLYQSAQAQKASSEAYKTTLDNYLQDTATQARIIGKNAYIRALNNGDSKAVAKTKAKSAVADYYSVKQVTLANHWDASISHFSYLYKTAGSTSGVSQGFTYNDGHEIYDNADTGTTSTQLANGSTITTQTITVGYDQSTEWSKPYDATITKGTFDSTSSDGGDTKTNTGLFVKAPTSDFSTLEYVTYSEYATKWSEIESQNTQIQSEMDTLVNNTYSAYQAGEINNSDLVDPYLLSSKYSAGSSTQSWAAAQLTLLGQNSPENFDQIGRFNISTGSGSQYEGVLFSAENPASGQFEANQTYDAANISGTQYVVTSDQIVELDGTFTIDQITDQNGQHVQNVTIEKTTYQTTNVTELKQQYEDLAKKYAEIEAREQNLQGSAGGGLLAGSSSSLVIGLIAVAALYAVAQRRTGGKY